jgi:hypothetical protein
MVTRDFGGLIEIQHGCGEDKEMCLRHFYIYISVLGFLVFVFKDLQGLFKKGYLELSHPVATVPKAIQRPAANNEINQLFS